MVVNQVVALSASICSFRDSKLGWCSKERMFTQAIYTHVRAASCEELPKEEGSRFGMIEGHTVLADKRITYTTYVLVLKILPRALST